MIKVLVVGAAGRMGSEVVSVVTAAENMDVVAKVDVNYAGGCEPGCAVLCFASLEQAIAETAPDVMVDFTRPDVVEANLRVALKRNVDCVVGTTGLSNDLLSELAELGDENTCLFFAPNFAIGAVLMMQVAQTIARYMPYCEVIEYHHDKKLDAPSGTSIRTAQLIAAARGAAPAAPGRETELEGLEGARGGLVDGVPVHSVRLPGLVAHQEVIFGDLGQTLTLRHDSIDRTSFMPGVILAVRNVSRYSGLVVGLENFMEE